jgi:hypothetical protein
MAKGNIQHDVLQLMDKYPVEGIIETMVTLGAAEGIEKWAAKYFTVPIRPQYIAGDELDKDLIRGVLHEIDLLKQRVARIELEKQQPGNMQQTGKIPPEIVSVIERWNPSLPLDDKSMNKLMAEVDKKTKQHLKHVGGLE